jgi:hypothetical protein
MEREQGVFQWVEDHNCKFGLDKFQLVDFTRRREANPGNMGGKTRPISRPDLMLRDQRIESRDTATFLGVIIDRELQWKQ